MMQYDTTKYVPAAPVAEVTLQIPQSKQRLSGVRMLIDTGADVSLLPKHSVDHLGVNVIPDETYEVVGFDGHRSQASVVEVDVIFCGKLFRGRYLLIDDEDGILGRDILNHFKILLDGPQQRWAEAGE